MLHGGDPGSNTTWKRGARWHRCGLEWPRLPGVPDPTFLRIGSRSLSVLRRLCWDILIISNDQPSVRAESTLDTRAAYITVESGRIHLPSYPEKLLESHRPTTPDYLHERKLCSNAH